MSKRTQLAFLRRLEKELEKTSKEYRNIVDRRVQNVTFSERAILRGVKDLIAPDDKTSEGRKFRARVIREVKPLVRSFVKDVTDIFTKYEGVSVLRRTGTSITFTVRPTEDSKQVFVRVKRIYDTRLNRLLEEVNSTLSTKFKRSQIWQLEHGYYEGVVETQIRDVFRKVIERQRIQKEPEIRQVLANEGVDWIIERKDDSDEMNIFLGSTVANQAEGLVSRELKQKLTQSLRTVIKKVEDDLIVLQGSDSLKDVQKKKVVKTVKDSFKKSKRLKVTTTDTKYSKTKRSASLSAKPKGKAVKESRPSKPKPIVAEEKIISLLAILNESLSETVAKNMGSPRLNYRTGRFANSVRAVDEARTPQGFPSIGYTYQLYPYQTFEPGFAQGSKDRDPRRLIDASIREIAIKLAVGRLYTRRV